MLIQRQILKKPESNLVFKDKFDGLRKFRIGEYIVIYALLKTDVLILRTGHRKSVCKSKI